MYDFSRTDAENVTSLLLDSVALRDLLEHLLLGRIDSGAFVSSLEMEIDRSLHSLRLDEQHDHIERDSCEDFYASGGGC